MSVTSCRREFGELTGSERFRRELAGIWKQRPAESLVTWIERELWLPAEESANPGPVQLSGDYHFLRGIVQAAEDPDVEDITIMKSAQICGTVTMCAILLGLACTRPAPAMLITPDDESRHELRHRNYAFCDQSPKLREIVPPDHLRNDHWLSIGHCKIHLGTSANKQSISGKSCRVVGMTECDRYDARKSKEANTIKLGRERTAMFNPRLHITESTPTIKNDSKIETRYEESNRQTYQLECPHCRHWQALIFFPHAEGPFAGRGGIHGLQDDAGNWRTPDEALVHAWYQCEKCGKRITDAEKAAAIPRGLWVPRGCGVERGILVGVPERSSLHSGFHLSRLYCPPEKYTFAAIAREYLKCRDDDSSLRGFYNNWLGLTYQTKNKTPLWFELKKKLCIPQPRGFVHPEAMFLTAGGDTQDDRVYGVVRAWWGRRGECTSALVDHREFFPRLDVDGEPIPDSDLVALGRWVLDTDWPMFGQPFKKFRVRTLCLDSGGHRTSRVYRFTRKYSTTRVRAVKGDTRIMSAWQRSLIDNDPVSGKPIDGGQDLWLLNVNEFKEDIHMHWRFASEDPGAWSLPENVDEVYLRHIANEYAVDKRKPDGHEKRSWNVRDHRCGVDYLDCEVYAFAAAQMWIMDEWDQVEAILNPPAPVQEEDDEPGYGLEI